jgi:hypothetical protein
MSQHAPDIITDELPPAIDYDGPADPEDLILAEPDSQPYTVVVFSLEDVIYQLILSYWTIKFVIIQHLNTL